MGRPMPHGPDSDAGGKQRAVRATVTGERGLVLIGGGSGCGKTALVDALVAARPLVYARVRSFTSRMRRPGEGDAEYEFVTREDLFEMHRRGDLVSLDEAYGEYYGMSCRAIEA